MTPLQGIALLPDAGPLITLAHADALDVPLKPGWSVMLVDMVLHEVTLHQTPTSQKLAQWVKTHQLPILATKIYGRYQWALSSSSVIPRKSNLGELAIQEAMNSFALEETPKTGVFLFENYKIARTSFILPENCRKVSTRAFLLFLEQKSWLDVSMSASDIERKAIQAGRVFSSLRFPP